MYIGITNLCVCVCVFDFEHVYVHMDVCATVIKNEKTGLIAMCIKKLSMS